jgi:hypothetical protein
VYGRLAPFRRYAEKVKRFLNSFFLDPETGMNPNLLHAQVYNTWRRVFAQVAQFATHVPRAGQANIGSRSIDLNFYKMTACAFESCCGSHTGVVFLLQGLPDEVLGRPQGIIDWSTGIVESIMEPVKLLRAGQC